MENRNFRHIYDRVSLKSEGMEAFHNTLGRKKKFDIEVRDGALFLVLSDDEMELEISENVRDLKLNSFCERQRRCNNY